MELYSNVFNKSKIYDTLFLKIFTVTEYSSIGKLQEKNPDKYEIFRDKYYDGDGMDMENEYEKLALTPEYSKIVGVTFCTINNTSDGVMKRNFCNIYNQDSELDVITKLFDVLQDATGKLADPLLGGHNILGYDIPFIIKRALKHDCPIPQILKKAINSKPWESCALDTMLLWKFGGYDYSSLNEIAVFSGLKYNKLPMDELLMNYKYWTDSNQNQDWYEKETMNRVNLTLQLMNKLRAM